VLLNFCCVHQSDFVVIVMLATRSCSCYTLLCSVEEESPDQ